MAALTSPADMDMSKVIQLIVFHLGSEEFGIPISEVREIIKAGPVTPLPDAPGFIGGLINVRGDIVTTIDLRARFSLPARGITECRHTVITKQRNNLFGLLVDEVTEVLRIPQSGIKPTPQVTPHMQDVYMSGVLPIDKRLIILLNLSQVLTDINGTPAGRIRDATQPARHPDDAVSAGGENSTDTVLVGTASDAQETAVVSFAAED